MANELIQDATTEAVKLVSETLASLTRAHTDTKTAGDEPKAPRLFFPNGIELIHFRLKFGNDIDITIAIAGEKAKYPGTNTGGGRALMVTNDPTEPSA